jgi:penicillin-binding protein 2
MAGKTGTAQVFGLGEEEEYDESKIEEHLRDHALFIAYAPAENPEISLSVVIENGGSGSKTAAPIARKLLDYYFQLKTQDAKNANGASHAQP